MNCCCFKTFFVFLCFQFLFSDPCFAAKLQRHENVSSDSIILDSNDTIREKLYQVNELSADGPVKGIPDGNDVRLSGYGGFVYYLFKKRQSAKVPSQKTDVAKTTANVATLETPSKRKYDLNFTKFEPSKKSKKCQKKKNKKKTTLEKTEDAPAPHVTVPPPPTAAAPPPEPAPFVPYAKIPRIFPRSLKSVKTDSLDETTKMDKLAMIEPAPVSLHHHCIKPANSNLLAEMKKKYPETCHDVMEGEVDLLCSPVSKMFASINKMTREYEQKLTAVGCDFDEYCRIVSISDGARRFLQGELTAVTLVYFAFGAEYHQYLTDDVAILSKLSIPLLMVIAFQSRFDDSNRKKACSLLRYVLKFELKYLTNTNLFYYFI